MNIRRANGSNLLRFDTGGGVSYSNSDIANSVSRLSAGDATEPFKIPAGLLHSDGCSVYFNIVTETINTSGSAKYYVPTLFLGGTLIWDMENAGLGVGSTGSAIKRVIRWAATIIRTSSSTGFLLMEYLQGNATTENSAVDGTPVGSLAGGNYSTVATRDITLNPAVELSLQMKIRMETAASTVSVAPIYRELSFGFGLQ